MDGGRELAHTKSRSVTSGSNVQTKVGLLVRARLRTLRLLHTSELIHDIFTNKTMAIVVTYGGNRLGCRAFSSVRWQRQ
jgi:hypothetical protein